jgi:hypothetical protein
MANKVYGTPMNAPVDPYTMNLKVKPQNSQNDDNINEGIRENVRAMWFYENNKT